jgi:hypothetical protein
MIAMGFFCNEVFAYVLVCLSRNESDLAFDWGPSGGSQHPLGATLCNCVICDTVSICDTNSKLPHFPGIEDSAAVCGVKFQPLWSLHRTAPFYQCRLLCPCFCQNIQWPSHVQENYQVMWHFSFWRQCWWGVECLGMWCCVALCARAISPWRWMRTGLIYLARGGNAILRNVRE